MPAGYHRPKPPPKKPKPKRPSGQLVPNVKHPFEVTPPTSKGSRRLQQRTQAAATADAKKSAAKAYYRKHAAERDPASLRGALSSAQVYPSRITPAPSRKLKPHEQRFNRAVQQAGIGEGLHTLLRPADQIAMALIQSPGGIYHLGKSFGYDVSDIVHGRVPKHVARDALAMGKQVGQDFRHPGRNPGYLFMDVAALGSAGYSAGVRTAAGLRALRAGESVGRAVRVAAKRPVPPMHTLRHGKLEVSAPYLDNPLAWTIQKWYRGKTPELNTRRMGSRLAAEQRVRHERDVALPHALDVAGRKATHAQQAALSSIAEGLHPMERAASEVKLARRAKTVAERHRHMKLARLYRKADHYVHEEGGKLVLSDTGRGRSLREKLTRQGVSLEELQKLHGMAKSAERRRTATLMEGDLLTPEAARGRRTAPAEVSRTGKPHGAPTTSGLSRKEFLAAKRAAQRNPGEFLKPSPEELRWREILDQGRLAKNQAAQNPDLYRVPATSRRRYTFGINRPTSGAVGFPKKEGALTNEYTGGLRLQGMERAGETTKLVAESELAGLKYKRVLDARDRLIKASHPKRLADDDVAVRTAALKGKSLSPETRALIEQEGAGTLSKAGKLKLEARWNKFTKDVFPDEFENRPGIVWVPKKIADGILPEPMLGGKISGAGKALATGVDVTNTLMKMGLLTLKGPGYLIPNLVGQVFLGLAHQGVHLPGNMLALRKLHKSFSPEDWQLLKAEGGSGIARVLESRGRLDLKAQAWLVGMYETVLDTPFRTSGVLHELHRRGIQGDKAILDYLHEPGNEVLRQNISHYAREAYIDFGKLGPTERTYVTRAFFLYPWLKGSTRYTLRFLVEHPAQAAVLVKLGQKQIERNKSEIGGAPDWFTESGSFKIGGSDAFPLTVNPQAATILGQTPQLLLEAQRDPVSAAFQHLSPAASLVLATGLKTSPFYGGPLYGSRSQIALDQTLGQTPIYQLLHPGPPSTGTYPGSRRKQAAGKMLLGGMFPRKTSRAALSAGAAKDKGKTKKDYFGGGGGSKKEKNYFGGPSGSSSKNYFK